MVTILSLWLPILLSAVFVFVASSIIHMVLPYHRSDFAALPDEEAARSALARTPPGDYVVPHAGSPEIMRSPEHAAKYEEGPVVFLTVLERGPIKMGASLLQWFLYCILVGVIAAYVTGRAVAPGGDYLEVFRFAGCTAFTGYAIALLQGSIWTKRKWSSTLKSMFDGLVYSLLTAGTFGWLWPGA